MYNFSKDFKEALYIYNFQKEDIFITISKNYFLNTSLQNYNNIHAIAKNIKDFIQLSKYIQILLKPQNNFKKMFK